MAADRERSLDGWGYTDEAVTDEEVTGLAELLRLRFPGADLVRAAPRPFEPALLEPGRLTPPPALAPWCRTDPRSRALHARGRSFSDVLDVARGHFRPAPDVVAVPPDAAAVAAVLEWCGEQGAACIPFGGGTSVVGGVTPPAGDRPVVTLQTRAMDRVLEVDRTSLAVRVQGGATGPALEEQLRPHGLSARFFPQSFELSTVGGWVATRAGGHFATRRTSIDDLVEQLTAVTPHGVWASRRVPASGAGPSPDRFLLGSEGAFGVITEAWLRVQRRPRFRAAADLRFPTFADGAEAVRALAQSGLDPANCRLLDPEEALITGVADGAAAVLLVAFESADVPVEAALAAALDLCRDLGGTPGPAGLAAGAGKASRDWRRSFLRAPYLRDALVALGIVIETFETAIPWSGLHGLHEAVRAATTAAVREVCGDGVVTCRITHAYEGGAALYYTVVAPGRRGSEAQQWRAVKQAASETILATGGTITHHHGVGRDHRPWYDRQRPSPFAGVLRAAKASLDPLGILNPGVLIDPS